MDIVARIKARCKEKGTTMGTLEKELNFGNGNIRRWDMSKPSVDRALAVAQKLEVSLDWLITGKEAADLTPEEQELVNIYRSTNATGQALTISNARTNATLLPADPAEQELPAGVSASSAG